MKMTATLIALTLGLLAIAGCGGGDTSSTQATETVTVEEPSSGSNSTDETAQGSSPSTSNQADHQDFIEQADAICQDLNSSVAGIQVDTLDQIVQAGPIEQKAIDAGLSRLQKLTPPPDLSTKFDQFIAAVEDQHTVFQQIVDAAANGDAQTVQSLAPALERARGRKSDIAIRAGFSECGSS